MFSFFFLLFDPRTDASDVKTLLDTLDDDGHQDIPEIITGSMKEQ